MIANKEKAFLQIVITDKHRKFIQFLRYNDFNSLDFKLPKEHCINYQGIIYTLLLVYVDG